MLVTLCLSVAFLSPLTFPSLKAFPRRLSFHQHSPPQVKRPRSRFRPVSGPLIENFGGAGSENRAEGDGEGVYGVLGEPSVEPKD